jgi:hypothetical protein
LAPDNDGVKRRRSRRKRRKRSTRNKKIRPDKGTLLLSKTQEMVSGSVATKRFGKSN